MTTETDKMSVCSLGPLVTRKIDTPSDSSLTQARAEERCPGLAEAAGGKWDGNWTNEPREALPDAEAVCGVLLPVYVRRALEAGPIWSNSDAQTKCPTVAEAAAGTWNGQWWTTAEGEMSVCEIDG